MSTFPELMNEIARLKNECITSTKQVSENDEKIHASIDKTVDNLESSIDVCSYPNREVQIPLSKIYTEDIPHEHNDELMIKVVDRFNSFKSAFENTSKKLTDLIYEYRKKLSDLGTYSIEEYDVVSNINDVINPNSYILIEHEQSNLINFHKKMCMTKTHNITNYDLENMNY